MKATELIKLTEKGKVYLTLSIQGNVLLQKWDGITPEEIFKKGIDKVSELLRVHKSVSSLVDVTTHSGVGLGSQKYAAKIISDYARNEFSAAHSGKKFLQVFVIPKDIFIKVSTQAFKNRVEEDVEIIFSNSITEA